MTIATTSRLKVNPPLGSLPTLEWRPLAELRIDPAYGWAQWLADDAQEVAA